MRRKYFLGMLLLLVQYSLPCWGYETQTSFYTPVDSLDFQTLKKTIVDGDLRSVDQTLGVLKKDYPRSFENYVLMYKSRSLQGASPSSPRAIVIAGSKRMVFSFNGKSGQAGFNNLEVMSFLPETSRFEFFEIQFHKNKMATFSKANPVKCMNCHQSAWRTQAGLNDPRPNWEPYNRWPGAFGSLDIHVKMGESKSMPRRLEGDTHAQEMLADYQNELAWLTDFETKIQPVHDRYKHLGPFDPKEPKTLTKLFSRLNSFRVARIVNRDKELYQTIKSRLALVLNDACKFSGVVDMAEKTKSGISYFQTTLATEFDAIFHPLGFRTEDWSMDFLTGGKFSAGEDRYQNSHSARAMMAMGFGKYDPQTFDPINQLFLSRGGSKGMEGARQSCDEMKATYDQRDRVHEERVFARVRSEHRDFYEKIPSRPLLERCISCHSNFEDGDAPWIPFDDPEALGQELQLNLYPRGTLMQEIEYRLDMFTPSTDRMPKGAVPSAKQKKDLLDDLKSLIGH